MKRKIVLILAIVLMLTTGCVNINKSSYQDLVDEIINSKSKLYNHVMHGYKYYLPGELKSTKVDDFNEVIASRYYNFYLYTDLVGFYNKVDNKYEVNSEYYYSVLLENGSKNGILNIIELDNDKYKIDVKYNYARVQVIVKKSDINECLNKALIIVASVKYNDDVISNMMNQDSMISSEEVVNVFDKDAGDSNQLEVDDTYTGNEEEDYDPDVIN